MVLQIEIKCHNALYKVNKGVPKITINAILKFKLCGCMIIIPEKTLTSQKSSQTKTAKNIHIYLQLNFST